MIPAVLAAITTALVLGYFLSQQAKRAEQAGRRADDAEAECDFLAEVLAAKDDAHAAERAEAEAELVAERSGWLQTLRTNIATAEKAMDDVAWAQGVLATCQLELDQRDRHTLLLTLDGIRADTEDGIRHEGYEPPLSRAVSEASVTPIRKRSGR